MDLSYGSVVMTSLRDFHCSVLSEESEAGLFLFQTCKLSRIGRHKPCLCGKWGSGSRFTSKVAEGWTPPYSSS
jgi:hypothetical protein